MTKTQSHFYSLILGLVITAIGYGGGLLIEYLVDVVPSWVWYSLLTLIFTVSYYLTKSTLWWYETEGKNIR